MRRSPLGHGIDLSDSFHELRIVEIPPMEIKHDLVHAVTKRKARASQIDPARLFRCVGRGKYDFASLPLIIPDPATDLREQKANRIVILFPQFAMQS